MNYKLLASLCLLTNIIYAQKSPAIQSIDTVIIGAKVPLSREHSGKLITKITEEQIEAAAGRSVARLLNEVAGIEINGSRSNAGQNLGYYIRGGRNRQVVIMVDGVQMNDPSQIDNSYDLRLIPTSAVSSIAILKGASSVLYGSGAATAVIHIQTHKSSDKPIAALFSSIIGTNRQSGEKQVLDGLEMNNAAKLSGSLGSFFYNINFNNRYTNGLSAVATPDASTQFDSDIFNSFYTRAQLGYRYNEKIAYSQFFSTNKIKADFDNFNYTDADNRSITSEIKTGGNFQWEYDRGVYVFNDVFSWIDREIISDFPTRYNTKTYTFDTYLTYKWNDALTGLIGLNHNSSQFESFTVPFGTTSFQQELSKEVANATIYDPYATISYISEIGLDLHLGARLNVHSEYGAHLLYHINPSYRIQLDSGILKLLASYSTAYTAPSLYQLRDPLYGNDELVPEENTTMEVGVEFLKDRKLRASLLGFLREEENFIDFISVDPDNFMYQYQNILERFQAKGIEAEVSATKIANMDLSANYTYTLPDDRFAFRIPKHKLNLSASYHFSERWNTSLHMQYNSSRTDRYFDSADFRTKEIELDAYELFDLRTSYTVSNTVKLFLFLNNILDKEYEEIYRFQTQGRNAQLGFSLSF
jgi:vitamin B12 transporter